MLRSWLHGHQTGLQTFQREGHRLAVPERKLSEGSQTSQDLLPASLIDTEKEIIQIKNVITVRVKSGKFGRSAEFGQ